MDRPTYDEDGRYIYYASELGGCTKALIAKRMRYKPKELNSKPGEEGGNPLLDVFREGNIHEEHILKWWEETGDTTVLNRQLEVNQEVGVPGVVVRGHIDGETILHVIEAKTCSDQAFRDIEVNRWNTPGLVQKYKWQGSVYAFARERPCVFVFKNRNTGKHLPMQLINPYTYDDIQTRILMIESQAEAGVLPVECDSPNFPCPFEYLHEEQDRVIRVDSEIDVLAREYTEAGDEIERLTKVRSNARNLIEEAMGDNLKLETIGGTRITRWQVKGRSKDSVDYKELLRILNDSQWGRQQVSKCTRKGGGESGGYSLRVTLRRGINEGNS